MGWDSRDVNRRFHRIGKSAYVLNTLVIMYPTSHNHNTTIKPSKVVKVVYLWKHLVGRLKTGEPTMLGAGRDCKNTLSNGKGFLIIISPFLWHRVCLWENSNLCHKVWVLFACQKITILFRLSYKTYFVWNKTYLLRRTRNYYHIYANGNMLRHAKKYSYFVT